MKRLISLCVVSVLLVLTFCSVPIFSAQDIQEPSESLQPEYTNKLNKLHFYFDTKTTEEKLASTAIATKEVSKVPQFAYIDDKAELESAIENMNGFYERTAKEDEPVNVTVEFKSDFVNTDEYAAFQREKENIKTLEDVRDYKKRLAAFSKEYHRKENERNLEKLGILDFSNLKISDYCPFVEIDMNKKDIKTDDFLKLTKDNKISNISFSSKDSFKTVETASWSRTLKEIEAYQTVTFGPYTGNGVKVGVLEVGGICDVNHKNLKSSNIHINPNRSQAISSHATEVTSIIDEMVPGAELYVSAASTDIASDLGWFIEQGCDVINCSFGYIVADEVGDHYEFVPNLAIYRFTVDKVYDYIIKANDISVVTAAGNRISNNTRPDYNPNAYVTSPGLAYNAITVGGLSCTLGFFDYDLEYDNGSCYQTTENRIKPEISAIYTVKIPNISGEKSGTSFAAPQVTASLAMLFQKYPSLAVSPFDTKAILMSSANETKNYSNISGSNFDPKVGAGCLSLEDLLDFENETYAIVYPNPDFFTPNCIGMTFSLKKNDILQAGASWPANVKEYLNISPYITNYDIKVYNSNQTVVYESSLGDYSNSEFLRYKIPADGTYRVAIYQNNDLPSDVSSELVAISVNIK